MIRKVAGGLSLFARINVRDPIEANQRVDFVRHLPHGISVTDVLCDVDVRVKVRSRLALNRSDVMPPLGLQILQDDQNIEKSIELSLIIQSIGQPPRVVGSAERNG